MGKRKNPPGICEICGEEFYPKTNKNPLDARFCSNRCRGDWRKTDPAMLEHMRSISAKGRASITQEDRRRGALKMSGPNNPAWKGGVTYFKKKGNYSGVKYVRCPEEFKSMARKDGYVMEHRLIVAQHIGRPLLRVEVVHHEDRDPTNNDPHNLSLFESNRCHKLYEHHGLPAPLWRL